MGSRAQSQSVEVAQAQDEQPDSGTPDDEYVINRITVGIIPKVWPELLQLMETTRYNRTDVINRAISIYAVVANYTRDGSELVFRHPETGKERIVEIL
jgi:hypothetical protein